VSFRQQLSSKRQVIFITQSFHSFSTVSPPFATRTVLTSSFDLTVLDDSARARLGCFLAPIPPLHDTNYCRCNHSVHDRARLGNPRPFGPIERLAGGFRDSRKARNPPQGTPRTQGALGTEFVPAARSCGWSEISPSCARPQRHERSGNGATDWEPKAIFGGLAAGWRRSIQKREPAQACRGGHRQARPYRDRK
jgi:hypothetical protein